MSNTPIRKRRRKAALAPTSTVPNARGTTAPPLPPRKRNHSLGGETGKILESQAQSYERATKAMHLSIQGATLDQIAKELGYNDKAAVHRAIQRRLDELHRQCLMTAEQWREHRLQALKSRERTLNLIVQDPKMRPADRIAAVRELNNIDKRIAAITGTDRPTEVSFLGAHVDVRTMSDAQLERLAAGDYGVLAEAAAGAGHPRAGATPAAQSEGGGSLPPH